MISFYNEPRTPTLAGLWSKSIDDYRLPASVVLFAWSLSFSLAGQPARIYIGWCRCQQAYPLVSASCSSSSPFSTTWPMHTRSLPQVPWRPRVVPGVYSAPFYPLQGSLCITSSVSHGQAVCWDSWAWPWPLCPSFLLNLAIESGEVVIFARSSRSGRGRLLRRRWNLRWTALWTLWF